jgi:hypothetical protein
MAKTLWVYLRAFMYRKNFEFSMQLIWEFEICMENEIDFYDE